ncbi:NTP transferase domain-containing protein [Avibacterium paragallinarum]|uniref:Pyrophosphorylase n=3 Tax=Avibacterium paragallinarum TaxID=728 RepID=L7R8U2_AVIPA|nr:pyrophosphorylase [Avibacterium paragallinarum 221]KAA6208858.1 NTP transferase domain-containing protein [Avibacterium paragallinarum]RZN70874.1 CTP--phosphocholine cytidylyltransferase [Avibacterium paragallinarum]
MLKKNSCMNAIILAAGLGSRFKEMTKLKHKSLFEINGVPNIERTIKYLQEAEIKDIYIVVGYLKEQFYYLKEKYGCHLIHNNKYKEYNNVYSFYLASEYFSNSYVIDADVVLFRNIFLESLTNSTYFTILRNKSDDLEWNPILDKAVVKDIIVSNKHIPSLLGISFWKESDAKVILSTLKEYINENIFIDPRLYWDNIPMKLLDKLNVSVKEISIYDGYEIDKLEGLSFLLSNLI